MDMDMDIGQILKFLSISGLIWIIKRIWMDIIHTTFTPSNPSNGRSFFFLLMDCFLTLIWWLLCSKFPIRKEIGLSVMLVPIQICWAFSERYHPGLLLFGNCIKLDSLSVPSETGCASKSQIILMETFMVEISLQMGIKP